jgi:hypothetical protein
MVYTPFPLTILVPGMIMGGILLLVIFSLLNMAQRGDSQQDQLEFELAHKSSEDSNDEECVS